MKQKLLNSFTWRATLLVAFLCCAFSSAWAEDYTLTNSNITWTGATSNNQYASSSTTYALSASFPGFIKSVTIDAKTNNKNCSAATTVKVDETQIGSTTIGNGSGNSVFSNSNDIYTNAITIEFKVTGKNSNHHLTVNSITVTYTPAAIIEIKSACKCQYDNLYYGTFSNASPFVCPTAVDDFTVSKVSVSNGTLSVESLTGVVPAGTGVLVSSSSSSNDKVKAVKLADPNKTYDPVDDNMLHPSSETMSGTDSYFYHLTFDENNPLGFYWGAEGGAAWNFSGTNKAYLKVLKTYSGYSAVKGFTLSDSADGIKAIETEKNSEMVFNLAGQRVSKMQKGIYVVNGKKILVK